MIEKMTVQEVGVDAGLIIISDLDWFKNKPGYKFEDRLSYLYDIVTGIN